MEENNLTAEVEVKDELVFTRNGEEVDRWDINMESTPNVTVSQSSGGGIKKAVGVVGAIAGLVTLGIVAYKKHEAKKRAEDETKWDRNIDVEKPAVEEAISVEPGEIIDPKDNSKGKKK